jgi:hypothetical protein
MAILNLLKGLRHDEWNISAPHKGNKEMLVVFYHLSPSASPLLHTSMSVSPWRKGGSTMDATHPLFIKLGRNFQ